MNTLVFQLGLVHVVAMVKWKRKTNLSLSVSKNHKQRKNEPEDTTHMIQQEYPPPKVIKKRKKGQI